VLAYLVVYHETGQPLLAAAAFPIGFIALLLARSELFTENFLVPVTARIAGRGSWPQLVRLWLVTLAANLVGGLVMAGLIAAAQLFHSVLDSILMFAGLLGGQAAYTWSDWAQALGRSGFGNLIGGIGLVTSLRLLQTPHRVAEERADQS
jgi:formate/nitrite transporter FocA (FNT family)